MLLMLAKFKFKLKHNSCIPSTSRVGWSGSWPRKVYRWSEVRKGPLTWHQSPPHHVTDSKHTSKYSRTLCLHQFTLHHIYIADVKNCMVLQNNIEILRSIMQHLADLCPWLCVPPILSLSVLRNLKMVPRLLTLLHALWLAHGGRTFGGDPFILQFSRTASGRIWPVAVILFTHVRSCTGHLPYLNNIYIPIYIYRVGMKGQTF